MTNVNEGHRKRLRDRMMRTGLDGFQDHELLEMFLFRLIPRKDTNKIAHELLFRFGSLGNVFDAAPEQLMMVKGISHSTACAISLEKELWRRYKISASQKISMAGLSSIIKYAHQIVDDSYIEKMVVVYVDHATNFIMSEEFTSENPLEIKVNIKDIVTTAVRSNAGGVIVFHCHINGECRPSKADITFTEKLFFTLANLNIVLLEHIIFNNTENYFSFFKENVLKAFASKYNLTTPKYNK